MFRSHCLVLLVIVICTASAEEAGRPRWRLDAGGLVDTYSDRRDDESEVFASLAYEIVPNVSLVGGIDLQHRYGSDDTRFDLSLYGPLADIGSGWLRLGLSPSNEFLPDHELEAAGEAPLPERLTAGARLTWRSYPDERILLPRPSLRWDLHDRIGIEAAWTWALSDAQPTTSAGELRLHWSAATDLAGWIGFSSGEENDPPLPIGQVEVLFAAVTWQASDQLGFRLDASHEWREGLYQRTGAGLAVTLRF